jgi:hypothetical protein
MSDLIVIGYPDEHRAHDVWAELVKLRHDNLVDLEDAAIIWRDEDGKMHVTTPAHQIKQGHVVLDRRDDWSEHQPSAKAENEFIEARGWDEYAHWHLGVDDEASEHTKARYKFPYGDFERVHRCGLNAAEVRAARQKYLDIEDAAIRLRKMMDKQDR